jgi:hypothetical protein
MRLYKTVLDKFAPVEMVTLRGTSEMKMEFTEEIRRGIVESRDLLNRLKVLVSEMQQTLERSRNLLEESYRLMDRLKVQPVFKDDPDR